MTQDSRNIMYGSPAKKKSQIFHEYVCQRVLKPIGQNSRGIKPDPWKTFLTQKRVLGKIKPKLPNQLKQNQNR